MKETHVQLQDTKTQEKRRNKFRLVVSEVSSFVGYPVSMSNTEV